MIYWIQEGFDKNNIINQIKQNKPPITTIISDTEWYIQFIDKEFLQEIQPHTKLQLLFGSFAHDWYSQVYPDTNILNWNTLWINWAEVCLRSVVDYSKVNYKNFIYPYICLNNKNSDLRCAIVDNLARVNIIDKGVVTWNKFLNQNHHYRMKYFDDQIRTVGDDFLNKQDSFIICKEFYSSLFHVVGESTLDVPFITEKTVIPILMKKPFVAMGCKGYNKKLVELGFEPYSEFIDYRFDDIDNYEERGSKLADSVKLIAETSNLQFIYNKLLPKIEHNYNRALQIINDINFIPEFVRNHIKEAKAVNKQLNITECRWDMFINKATPRK